MRGEAMCRDVYLIETGVGGTFVFRLSGLNSRISSGGPGLPLTGGLERGADYRESDAAALISTAGCDWP